MATAKPQGTSWAESQAVGKWIQILAMLAGLSIVPLFGWILSIERRVSSLPETIPPMWLLERIDKLEQRFSARVDKLESKMDANDDKLRSEITKNN